MDLHVVYIVTNNSGRWIDSTWVRQASAVERKSNIEASLKLAGNIGYAAVHLGILAVVDGKEVA